MRQHRAALVLAAALGLPLGARAQWATGDARVNASIAAQAAALTEALQNAPRLEDIFYPAKYRLPTDFYVRSTAGGRYVQNVLFDPCRQHGFACCNDTFGTPEYASPAARVPEGEDLPRRRPLRADGGDMPAEASRRPDDELVLDVRCTGPGAPLPACVALHLASRPFRLMPRCWDFNGSVVADKHCRAPADGSPVQLCLELGVTQNAFVMECGGAHASDPHCGTYLEVHRPGWADVIAEARLPGMFTSGYRMTVITTTYKGAPDRVICFDPRRQGRYEIWWVQRTLYNFVLERRVPFQVTSPLCDWDAANDRYKPYATVDPDAGAPQEPWTTGDAVSLEGGDPFEPRLFRLSRLRVEGDPAHGRPGTGMGGTMVPPGSLPGSSAADPGAATPLDDSAYVYTPDAPLETVRSGRLEPPNVPPDLARRRQLQE